MTVETIALPEAVELAEKIKNSFRAKWDEIRFQDEATGEVSPTQYDLTLEMKGGNEQLDFSYRDLGDGERRWYFLTFVETGDVQQWVSRHDREVKWVAVPDMLGKSLWDIVTVHGEDAAQRGWSDIDRKDASPEEPKSPSKVAFPESTGARQTEKRGSWLETK